LSITVALKKEFFSAVRSRFILHKQASNWSTFFSVEGYDCRK
jgi:hypothetical protein